MHDREHILRFTMARRYGSTDDVCDVPEDFHGSVRDLLNFDTKLYTRRWLMLFLFVNLELLTGFQWVGLSIVEDVLSAYYQVHPVFIEWTSTVFSFACIFFCIPASWLIGNYGLRGTLLLCGSLNAIGCVLKAYAIGRDDFALQFVGQASVGICQALVIAAPPRVASVWFGPSEVSTASSIGVLGFQAGVAVGFLIPPFVIRGGDEAVTEEGLEIINWTLAGLSLVVLLCMAIWLEEQPPAPPSKAALKQREFQRSSTFLSALRVLIQTKGYVLLLIAYGINFSSYCALAALLNAFILTYYPDAQKDAGCIGLTMAITGIVGLLATGRILDKTKLFKEVFVVTYAMAVLSTVLIAFYLDSGSILIQYFTIGSLGHLRYSIPQNNMAAGDHGAILTIIVVGMLCKKAAPELLGPPLDSETSCGPNYDVTSFVTIVNLQFCTIVEIGQGYCSLFVEFRSGNSPVDLNGGSVAEVYLGSCECSVFRSWELCSLPLKKARPYECSFEEEPKTNNSQLSRVHRRLCNPTAMAKDETAEPCDCSKQFAQRTLYPVIGFPTCYRAPMPNSVCTTHSVCGVYGCQAKNFDGLALVRCDVDCLQGRPFCEDTNQVSAIPPTVTSFWSQWTCSIMSNEVIEVSEAVCLEDGTHAPAFDCLGPGVFCCPMDGVCHCETSTTMSEMKLTRFFATALFTVGFEVATELSYPTPEGTTNGLVSFFSQLLSVIVTTVAATTLPYVGARWCLFGFSALYSSGAIVACFIPKNYKRQDANAIPSLSNTIRLK